MADVKISALNALGAAPAADDLLPVVDVSGSETKKLRIDELFTSPSLSSDARITNTSDSRLILSNTSNANPSSAAGIELLEGPATGNFGTASNFGFKIALDGSDNTLDIFSGVQTDVKKRMRISRDNGDISFYEDTGTTAKFFWDASTDRLGINTTAPLAPLHVNNNDGVQIGSTSSYHLLLKAAQTPVVPVGGSTLGAVITTSGTGAGSGHVGFEIPANDTNDGFYVVTDSNTDGTPDTLAMKISAAGHTFFGKTSASVTTTGIQLLPNSDSAFTRDDGLVLYLNRTTSDGSILEFRKDNANIGSIGGTGSTLDIGSGDANLRFNPALDSIYPVTIVGGSARDAVIDLGVGVSRFKNLYLSGGVYLGGTGAANLLDDYEEGTWTPVLSDGTNTVTLSAVNYTKTGRTVTCTISSYNVDTSSLSGPLKITGLPFATQSVGQAVPLHYRDGVSEGYSVYGYMGAAATELILRINKSPATSGTNISATSAVTIFSTFTYMAN